MVVVEVVTVAAEVVSEIEVDDNATVEDVTGAGEIGVVIPTVVATVVAGCGVDVDDVVAAGVVTGVGIKVSSVNSLVMCFGSRVALIEFVCSIMVSGKLIVDLADDDVIGSSIVVVSVSKAVTVLDSIVVLKTMIDSIVVLKTVLSSTTGDKVVTLVVFAITFVEVKVIDSRVVAEVEGTVAVVAAAVVAKIIGSTVVSEVLKVEV